MTRAARTSDPSRLRAALDARLAEVWEPDSPIDAAFRRCLGELLEASPRDERAEVYESLLAYEPRSTPDGPRLVRTGFHRKGAGIYYTDPELARALVEKTLAPWSGDRKHARRLRVLDPAMGVGCFLRAARAYRTGLRLYGMDVDPTAVGIARLFVDGELLVGDALLELEGRAGWEGFDAVLGNPPWETFQPQSKEFFTRVDPGYARLSRREALARRAELFAEDAALAPEWDAYQAEQAGRRRALRERYRLSSGKLASWRLFLELGNRVLREGGRLGMLVPCGLYADEGSHALRSLFLDDCRWEEVAGFENRDRLFAGVDNRVKFCAVVLTKGGRTRRLSVSFMHTSVESWRRSEPLVVDRRFLARTSPRTGVLCEVESERDRRIFELCCANGLPILDGFGLDYRQGDYNLTADAHHFLRAGEASDLIPLCQGAQLAILEPPRANAHHYIRASEWRARRESSIGLRLVFRTQTNATNERSAIATLVDGRPCGNSIGILSSSEGDRLALLYGAGVMASFVYDWTIRRRMAGTNLNRHVLAESRWPRASRASMRDVARIAAKLALGAVGVGADSRRRMLAELELIVARLYGLGTAELAWILRGCDQNAGVGDDPKGFWRVDKELPPCERLPQLVLTMAELSSSSRASKTAQLPTPVGRTRRSVERSRFLS